MTAARSSESIAEPVSPHVYLAWLLEQALPAVAHADTTSPHEVVGIIASDGSVYPLINQRRSASEFEVSSRLVREGIEQIKARDLEPVAFYHSHPTRTADPSDRDKDMIRQGRGFLFAILGIDRFALYMWDDKLKLVTEVPRV